MRFWPFARRSCAASPWDLSNSLLTFGREDSFRVADAVEGVAIFGSTGAGKSSGSGAALARAYLAAGFGGCVLTVKSGERSEWEGYLRDVRRSNDLLLFGPDHDLAFNFLDWELARAGAGSGQTENVVNLFSVVLDAAQKDASSGGREDEGYWKNALRQLLRNVTDLLILSEGRLSVPDMYRVVISAPTSFEQLRSEEWKARSFCHACLQKADRAAKSRSQTEDFKLVADYFLVEFPGLSEKTRSIIVSTFTSTADLLNRGLLRELLSSGTNVTPGMLEEGKVLLLDLPIHEFADVGRIAQVIMKYAFFQRSIERRDVKANARPVFFWADEFQHFVTSYDATFLSTCRSARVATVMLTQSLTGLEAALGGEAAGKAEAAALLGNCNTKIFHGNSDVGTNEWAASLIGRKLRHFANSNASHSAQDWAASVLGLGDGGHQSAGFSESYEYELQPSVFSEMRTGGPANDCIVDGVLFASGRTFSNARNWLPVNFRQERSVAP